jgi:hypothetical protein
MYIPPKKPAVSFFHTQSCEDDLHDESIGGDPYNKRVKSIDTSEILRRSSHCAQRVSAAIVCHRASYLSASSSNVNENGSNETSMSKMPWKKPDYSGRWQWDSDSWSTNTSGDRGKRDASDYHGKWQDCQQGVGNKQAKDAAWEWSLEESVKLERSGTFLMSRLNLPRATLVLQPTEMLPQSDVTTFGISNTEADSDRWARSGLPNVESSQHLSRRGPNSKNSARGEVRHVRQRIAGQEERADRQNRRAPQSSDKGSSITLCATRVTDRGIASLAHTIAHWKSLSGPPLGQHLCTGTSRTTRLVQLPRRTHSLSTNYPSGNEIGNLCGRKIQRLQVHARAH